MSDELTLSERPALARCERITHVPPPSLPHRKNAAYMAWLRKNVAAHVHKLDVKA